MSKQKERIVSTDLMTGQKSISLTGLFKETSSFFQKRKKSVQPKPVERL